MKAFCFQPKWRQQTNSNQSDGETTAGEGQQLQSHIKQISRRHSLVYKHILQSVARFTYTSTLYYISPSQAVACSFSFRLITSLPVLSHNVLMHLHKVSFNGLHSTVLLLYPCPIFPAGIEVACLVLLSLSMHTNHVFLPF